jgi:hypothetical protein
MEEQFSKWEAEDKDYNIWSLFEYIILNKHFITQIVQRLILYYQKFTFLNNQKQKYI